MRATCQTPRWSQPPGRPAGPGRPRSATRTCPPAAAPASTRQPHPAADAWASPPFCTCPVCGGPLTPATSPTPSLRPPLVCPAGHAYDRGREGHFFLLPTGRKRREAAGPAGDADAQVRARRAFFDGGHFDPIHAAAAGAVCEVLGRRRRREGGSSSSRPPFVLDAGCGEGAYARALASHPSRPPATACLGIDVSKPAVRMAASRARGAAGAAAATRFAVASTFAIPLPPGSVDCALVAMAPAPPAGELARVLVPGSGGLVVVRPGPAHLDGLRRAVYGGRARFGGGGEEKKKKEGGVDDGSSGGDHAPLCLLSRARLTFDLALPGPDAAALLGMTPYAWSAGRGLGERLGVEGLETQVDVWVEAFGFV